MESKQRRFDTGKSIMSSASVAQTTGGAFWSLDAANAGIAGQFTRIAHSNKDLAALYDKHLAKWDQEGKLHGGQAAVVAAVSAAAEYAGQGDGDAEFKPLQEMQSLLSQHSTTPSQILEKPKNETSTSNVPEFGSLQKPVDKAAFSAAEDTNRARGSVSQVPGMLNNGSPNGNPLQHRQEQGIQKTQQRNQANDGDIRFSRTAETKAGIVDNIRDETASQMAYSALQAPSFGRQVTQALMRDTLRSIGNAADTGVAMTGAAKDRVVDSAFAYDNAENRERAVQRIQSGPLEQFGNHVGSIGSGIYDGSKALYDSGGDPIAAYHGMMAGYNEKPINRGSEGGILARADLITAGTSALISTLTDSNAYGEDTSRRVQELQSLAKADIKETLAPLQSMYHLSGAKMEVIAGGYQMGLARSFDNPEADQQNMAYYKILESDLLILTITYIVI